MATTTTPVQQLSAVINRLCNLANDPNVSDAQQSALLDQANRLNGDLVKLVTQQLDDTDPDYKNFMGGVGSVTSALNTAEASIQATTGTVSDIAAVTGAINSVIQQGIQLVTIAAKYAAA